MKVTLNRIFSIYSYYGTYLNLRVAIVLFFLVIVLGTVGFMILEGYTVVEAFYMAIITISTVGFTEVKPLHASGQIFTSFLILLNVGVVAYTASAFSYYVIQGEIFKKMHENWINGQIENLRNHVIICGYGKYGREIVEYFQKQRVNFVIVELNEDKIEAIQKNDHKILFVNGDATHDEILETAGVDKAAAIISAMADDSDNVFTVLTARQLNPKIKIISRCQSPNSATKLKRAGANHVIMPEQIGGFYMATLVNKPGATEFFSYISNEYESDIGFEEIEYEDLPISCKALTIAQLNLRQQTGVNIIAHKTPDGHFSVNPKPETVLIPGASFVVLGDHKQLESVKTYFEKIRNGVIELGS